MEEMEGADVDPKIEIVSVEALKCGPELGRT